MLMIKVDYLVKIFVMLLLIILISFFLLLRFLFHLDDNEMEI